ncbi:alpha/beta hydrolase [Alicyclobacillus cycloheptanicus]|uniref:Pimeloyl-ACP methyl ester carboxylesterase n=1 Tax=Alicyclobacillus cycloheptanicus TaxID=1457 RepID=A0ABT9XK77_9BACL|nr:alpha/beta hydrolase [Alicyclobacillus cycloheptanicus]MDQ0190126.1 pimeloyl-ACP methyl ester carboxylesterase [Alicyclobacillus cycloheptanicus]WDM02098.1 alpha/beta hydrolase [Alicyclobacillus cycloheptanicus]
MPYLSSGGVRLHYEVRGQGVPILFIHPPVLSSTCFALQTAALSKTFKTITFDIRGHGRSQASPTPLTYDLIVSDMQAVLNAAGEDRAFLCGYSMGGSIALEFLLQCPERAQGAILIGGFSEVQSLYLRGLVTAGIALTHPWFQHFLAWGLAKTNSVRETFRETLAANLQCSFADAQAYYRCSLTYDCTERVSAIEQPVLLLYGQHDRPFHPYGKQLYERLPNSQLVYIPASSHRIPSKQPALLNLAISRFVKKHAVYPGARTLIL